MLVACRPGYPDRWSTSRTQPMIKLLGTAWLILCLGAGQVVACAPEAQGCNFMLVDGIDLTVSDAATGSPICDAEVTAIKDGSGDPETFWRGDCSYRGASRAGEYEILVRKAGYA